VAVREIGRFGLDADEAALDKNLMKPAGFSFVGNFNVGVVAPVIVRAVPLGAEGERLAFQQAESEGFAFFADFHGLFRGDAAEVRGLLTDAGVVALAAAVTFEGAFWSIDEIKAEFRSFSAWEAEHETVSIIVAGLQEGAILKNFVAARFGCRGGLLRRFRRFFRGRGALLFRLRSHLLGSWTTRLVFLIVGPEGKGCDENEQREPGGFCFFRLDGHFKVL